MSEPESETQSAVEWLELFFDLVAVAAVAVLTEGLREDPTWAGFGLFAVLYGAVWLSWVSVVLYANVAGEGTRVRTVVWAMFLLAVMAATAPGHFERRANLFAVAFLLVRATAARGSLNTGRLLTSWPLLQAGGLAVPWVVSLWPPPPWKFVLWGAALAVDLLVVILRDEDDSRWVERFSRDYTERARRTEQAAARGHPRREVPEVRVVDVDATHLDERLGLFVIIVLGEAVTQIVVPAATTVWSWTLVATAVLGFVALAGLWWLTFSYGFTAAPHTRVAALAPRYALPMHLATTFGIACLAAGLGDMISNPDDPVSAGLRWVMGGGLALHFLVTGAGGWAAGAPTRWLLAWALPCSVAPVVVAVVGGRLGNWTVTACLLAVVAWMLVYARVAATGREGPASGQPGE